MSKTNGRQLKTLLIDDDPAFYEMLRPLSAKFGIRFVNNLDDASTALSNTQYDLVLLDLNFDPNKPEKLDGITLIERFTNAPIIVLTNNKEISIHNDVQLRGAKRSLYKGDYDPSKWAAIFLDVIKEYETFPAPSKHLALIMKGGGVKGLAYIGALRELEQHYKFNWYVGTSAGAIAACLLGCGYTVDELEVILSEKKFTDFLDASKFKAVWNLLTKSGLYEANTFEAWLDKLLSYKLQQAVRVKFKDLKHRVTIYASRRYKSAVVFDSSDPGMADVPVAFAARCSMSIPFYFTPQKQYGMSVYDGGMQNNFPVQRILETDPNTPFIGLYLGNEFYQGLAKKPNIFQELYHIYNEANDIEALEKYKDRIVVIDPSPIKTKDFNLSSVQKEFLILAGKVAALKFLRRNNSKIELACSDVENLKALRSSLYK